MRHWCLLLVLLLAACASRGQNGVASQSASAPLPSPPPAVAGAEREQMVWIPVTDASGQVQHLIARLCRPDAAAPVRVAVINHGAPPDAADVRRMEPTACDSAPARWFLARGYLVVFALRRGYGASTGPIAEASGSCEAPDYLHAALEGARDVDSIVRFATALSFARSTQAVVVGQSTGGWATIAYGAGQHPGATAFISMAGGRGGRAFSAPATYCRPERLVAAAGRLGETARTPMLWVSAANDTYFDPALERAMQAAFNAGGGHADLVVTPPFDTEGHRLFYGQGGDAIWGPLFDTYLADVARTPRTAALAAGSQLVAR